MPLILRNVTTIIASFRIQYKTQYLGAQIAVEYHINTSAQQNVSFGCMLMTEDRQNRANHQRIE